MRMDASKRSSPRRQPNGRPWPTWAALKPGRKFQPWATIKAGAPMGGHPIYPKVTKPWAKVTKSMPWSPIGPALVKPKTFAPMANLRGTVDRNEARKQFAADRWNATSNWMWRDGPGAQAYWDFLKKDFDDYYTNDYLKGHYGTVGNYPAYLGHGGKQTSWPRNDLPGSVKAQQDASAKKWANKTELK